MNLLFRDSDLVVAEKPAGMLVHPSDWDRRSGPTAMDVLRDELGCRVHPVHRLDRAASGCLMMALSPEATTGMSELWPTSEVKKRYWVVVRGWVEDSGRIDRALVQDNGGDPKPALTEFRCLERGEVPISEGPFPKARVSWVEAEIFTGRFHQLRRHFAGQGHPVLGDSMHGDGRHNRLVRSLNAGEKRLLLHARSLSFRHFRSGEHHAVVACPDPTFIQLLESLFGVEAVARRLKEPVA